VTAENILLTKSYNFALCIVNLYKFLQQENREFLISKLIFRSGTAIGANFEEAISGQSGKDFITKLQIVYNEARETHY